MSAILRPVLTTEQINHLAAYCETYIATSRRQADRWHASNRPGTAATYSADEQFGQDILNALRSACA